jgi:hypothetical protein
MRVKVELRAFETNALDFEVMSGQCLNASCESLRYQVRVGNSCLEVADAGGRRLGGCWRSRRACPTIATRSFVANSHGMWRKLRIHCSQQNHIDVGNRIVNGKCPNDGLMIRVH